MMQLSRLHRFLALNVARLPTLPCYDFVTVMVSRFRDVLR